MEILPIKLIDDNEKAIFGVDLYNLGRLKRLGLPVALGVGVVIDALKLGKILPLNQDITQLKREIKKIPLPEVFSRELRGGKYFFFEGKFFQKKADLWQALVEGWIEEWMFSKNLFPHGIFLMKKPSSFVKAYFDPEAKEVLIETQVKLSPSQLQQIDRLILSANRALFLPQVYQLVVDKEIQIVGLVPFTQVRKVINFPDRDVSGKKEKVGKSPPTSAVKVFLSLKEGLVVAEDFDGAIMEHSRKDGLDECIFRLGEIGLSFPGKPIIYQLPGEDEMLKVAAQALLASRNKHGVLNIWVGLPAFAAQEEFWHLKKELASRGVYRRGTLKFWAKMDQLENFLNLEKYLEDGLDGGIIDLDKVAYFLVGSHTSLAIYPSQLHTIYKFLESPLKAYHQYNLPVVVKGKIIHQIPEVLDFLIEKGIFGVVGDLVEAQPLRDYLRWSEKRLLLKKKLG